MEKILEKKQDIFAVKKIIIKAFNDAFKPVESLEVH
jgi:DNA-binding protein YbaB